jgi:DNA polymerase-3 subunit beta
MNFTCTREALTFGVKTAGRALGAHSAMPILGGIKLAAQGDKLTLAATDLERAIVCAVPIENKGESGTVVLSGEILSKIINVLPEETVQIKLSEQGERVDIISGEATFDLLLMALEDYPEIPAPPEKPYGSIERTHLQRGLELTTFAAMSARETSRLNLTGVNLLFQDTMVKLVATNGYRLAYREEKLAKPVANPGDYLVAAESLKDLSGILASLSDEQVTLHQEGSHLFFQSEQVLFLARLISEEYPDFDRVIPKGNKIGLHLDRQALLNGLQRAQITTAAESGAVLFRAQGQKLRLSSSSVEKGQTEEMLTLHKSVDEINISFRGEYLIDALRRMSSNQVVFWLADAESAGLLEPAGDDESAEDDRGFLYVCMPIRMDL